jgi:hypothetical protein
MALPGIGNSSSRSSQTNNTSTEVVTENEQIATAEGGQTIRNENGTLNITDGGAIQGAFGLLNNIAGIIGNAGQRTLDTARAAITTTAQAATGQRIDSTSKLRQALPLVGIVAAALVAVAFFLRKGKR